VTTKTGEERLYLAIHGPELRWGWSVRKLLQYWLFWGLDLQVFELLVLSLV
jgi:hypothetical protein